MQGVVGRKKATFASLSQQAGEAETPVVAAGVSLSKPSEELFRGPHPVRQPPGFEELPCGEHRHPDREIACSLQQR
jgi:hypothetical protein